MKQFIVMFAFFGWLFVALEPATWLAMRVIACAGVMAVWFFFSEEDCKPL